MFKEIYDYYSLSEIHKRFISEFITFEAFHWKYFIEAPKEYITKLHDCIALHGRRYLSMLEVKFDETLWLPTDKTSIRNIVQINFQVISSNIINSITIDLRKDISEYINRPNMFEEDSHYYTMIGIHKRYVHDMIIQQTYFWKPILMENRKKYIIGVHVSIAAHTRPHLFNLEVELDETSNNIVHVNYKVSTSNVSVVVDLSKDIEEYIPKSECLGIKY